MVSFTAHALTGAGRGGGGGGGGHKVWPVESFTAQFNYTHMHSLVQGGGGGGGTGGNHAHQP